MKYNKILITGGAGFVGSNLALRFKNEYPNTTVICLDNLKRRGSELNLVRLKEAGIEFLHGDIRNKEDLEIEDIDLLIECSAEPSVLAGTSGYGSPEYVINTNLAGTLNCLELARKVKAKFVFISTSRVYPYNLLNSANIAETETRFSFEKEQNIEGISELGISEECVTNGARSLYGATKLSSEMFITEYIETYGLEAIINRFGCIAGPWQMGKVDQGVMSLWVSRFIYNGNLKYVGFNGLGKQVRDFIHIDDVFDILNIQINSDKNINGEIFNIGGGLDNSVSLKELTSLSEKVTGNKLNIGSDEITRPGDLKIYISDNSKIKKTFDWEPKRRVEDIVKDTANWINSNKQDLEKIFK